MVGGDRIVELCRDVTVGAVKEECVRNDEEGAAWDRLVVQVAEIHAKGGSVEIPWDPAAD
jgi:hypothetical protein